MTPRNDLLTKFEGRLQLKQIPGAAPLKTDNLFPSLFLAQVKGTIVSFVRQGGTLPMAMHEEQRHLPFNCSSGQWYVAVRRA